MVNLPHDVAYKEFFSNPDMLKSLLLDFVQEDFVRDFNFDTLELCNPAYTGPDLNQRQDDLVWRLRWKDTWCYIYIMLEFQSRQDYWMALRIAAYTALLWETLVKNGEIKQGDKLPPVLPIVIYNGERRWKADVNLKDLIYCVHSELSKYQLGQKYFLLDENRLSEWQINGAEGTAGFIFRLERAKSIYEIKEIYSEFMDRISGQEFDFLRRSVKFWILKLMRRKKLDDWDKPEEQGETEGENIMLEEKFRRWEQDFIARGKAEGILEGKAEGILEGKAEGILEGKAEGMAEGLASQKDTLLEMLALRFGEIPEEWRTGIEQLEKPETISQLTIAILTAKSQKEYNDQLNNLIKR